jgi:hypothetical protein
MKPNFLFIMSDDHALFLGALIPTIEMIKYLTA